MSNARNLANLLGTSTQIKTAKVADEVFQANESLIINGDMAIAQRNSSSAVTAANDAATVDRFKFNEGTDGTYTSEQSSTAPDGFSNSVKLAVTGDDTSLSASQYAYFYQSIEAQNLQHLKYGTSAAEDITLSFWVRSSKTGTYCVTLDKNDATRYQFVKEYSIDAANTWEYKTITIAPDSNIKASGGAIANDNGHGIRVFWWLASGTTYNGATDNAWSSDTNDFVTTNQVNWMDSTSNDFYITGCKLEVGSVATPFRHESMAENLAKCHRYYYRIPAGNTYQRFGTGQNSSTTLCRMTPIFPVEMRVTPTIDTTGTAANYGVYEAGSVKTCTAIPVLSSSQSTNKIAEVYFTTNSLTAGRGAACLANNNNTVYLGYNAEL